MQEQDTLLYAVQLTEPLCYRYSVRALVWQGDCTHYSTQEGDHLIVRQGKVQTEIMRCYAPQITQRKNSELHQCCSSTVVFHIEVFDDSGGMQSRKEYYAVFVHEVPARQQNATEQVKDFFHGSSSHRRLRRTFLTPPLSGSPESLEVDKVWGIEIFDPREKINPRVNM